MNTHDEPPAFFTPDGSQWVLNESGNRSRAQEELTNYYDRRYKPNKKFKYDRLTSMTRRIRLLRLLPGSGNSEIVCELFEAELREGRAFLPPGNEIIEYDALSWSWGVGKKNNLILIRKGGANERTKAADSLIVSTLALALIIQL